MLTRLKSQAIEIGAGIYFPLRGLAAGDMARTVNTGPLCTTKLPTAVRRAKRLAVSQLRQGVAQDFAGTP